MDRIHTNCLCYWEKVTPNEGFPYFEKQKCRRCLLPPIPPPMPLPDEYPQLYFRPMSMES